MIERLWVKNYRSLEDVKVSFSDLNVIVGLNGAGKSNLIDVLRFVSEALLFGLDVAVFKRMGMRGLRRWSANQQPYDIEIGLVLRTEAVSAEYSFTLGSGANGGGKYRVKVESCLINDGANQTHFKTENGKWVENPLGISAPIPSNSLFLSIIAGIEPYQEVYEFLTGMSFYNPSPNALREPQKFVHPYPLAADGKNLAAALFELEQIGSDQVERLKSALNYVLGDIDDYRIDQVGGHLVVKLHHEMSDSQQTPWFELAQESDGTLRMLGILSALYQEPSRTLIAIEEPEVTVHPATIVRVWDEIVEASKRTQIILTTHSPDLLDLCTADQLRVVEKINGITYVGFVEAIQKEIIQEKLFSPGQLWKAQGQLLRATGD